MCLFVERLQHYLTSQRMIQVNINVKVYARELTVTGRFKGFPAVSASKSGDFIFRSQLGVWTDLMDSDRASLYL